MNILEIYRKKLRYKNYSLKTINVYVSHLKNFIILNEIKDPYQVTIKQIVGFLESHDYSSTSQQNQYIGSLKLFAKYVLNKKDIHLNKIERPIREKKLPKVLDNDFVIEKLSKIENIKHRAILTLTYSVGLRVSEIVNLRIEDIDSKRMIIQIRNAKGKKDRIVPLSKNVLILLRKYYSKKKPIFHLFNGQKLNNYSVTSCQRLYKKYIDNKTSIHSLRHSCFTYLLESGVDIRVIQAIAGHKSIKTTQIYTHISKNIFNKINLPT